MDSKESYTEFAHIYDELMTDIPYDTYVDLISLAAGGLKGKQIIDVGCGTGLLAVKLAKAGALVTGVDLSRDMLNIAEKRARDLSLKIDFLEKPMQEIEGQEKYDAAVIAIDSLNYLPDRKSVLDTFIGIHSVLKSGGMLMFDVHSTFKTDVIFMEGPFTYEMIESRTFGIRRKAKRSILSSLNSVSSSKRKAAFIADFNERHVQKTYSVFEYVDLLQKGGFTIERIFADWEDEPPHEESERIFFQVRK